MKDIKVFTSDLDEVIDSYVAMGMTTYEVALDKLYPLINRFEAQRKLQDKNSISGCKETLLRGVSCHL